MLCMCAPNDLHHELVRYSVAAHHLKRKSANSRVENPNDESKIHFDAEDVMLPLTTRDRELIKKMAQSNTGTAIESNMRRLLAVVYVQSAKSIEIIDMFQNFLLSAHRNAPEFAESKLLVAALDEEVSTFAHNMGHQNIVRFYNGSTNMASTFKFRLVQTLLSFNVSLLIMEADQVVLKNPFSGLVGDCDIELASDYPRPSLAFGDMYALDNPLDQPIREIADSANIGLILFTPSVQVFVNLN